MAIGIKLKLAVRAAGFRSLVIYLHFCIILLELDRNSKPTISFFRVVQAKNAEKRWEVKNKKTQVPSPKKLNDCFLGGLTRRKSRKARKSEKSN